MMADRQPVLFLSHGGGPSYYISAKDMPIFKGMDKDSKAARFLRNLTQDTDLSNRPQAILVLSAHWEETEPTVNTNAKHTLYYDYGNFPQETYQLKWPVDGCPYLATKVRTILAAKGFVCRETARRGLDHGVFVPLKLAYPDADIPVTQLSLVSSMNVKEHLAMAEALGELSAQGILIIGSGFATHEAGVPGAPTPKWTLEFKNWLHDVLLNEEHTPEERKKRLLFCQETAPHLAKAHPTIDHFLPLLMCCAASGYKPGRLLYSEIIMQTLLNEHYLF